MNNQAASPAWAYPKADRRRQPRWQTDMSARLIARTVETDCRVRDVSEGGARIETAADIDEDEIVVLCLDELDPLAARVVHLCDGAVGLMFIYGAEQRQQVVDWITPKLAD